MTIYLSTVLYYSFVDHFSFPTIHWTCHHLFKVFQHKAHTLLLLIYRLLYLGLVLKQLEDLIFFLLKQLSSKKKNKFLALFVPENNNSNSIWNVNVILILFYILSKKNQDTSSYCCTAVKSEY